MFWKSSAQPLPLKSSFCSLLYFVYKFKNNLLETYYTYVILAQEQMLPMCCQNRPIFDHLVCLKGTFVKCSIYVKCLG